MSAKGFKSTRPTIVLLSVFAAATLSACTSLSLAVANFPAVFGAYEAQRDVRYGELDRQALDVYVPERSDAVPLPIIVFVHGGGWTSGSKNDYRFVGEALTSRGFVVVVPSYRLYPQVRFPDFVDDIALAVAWSHTHAAEFGGDPSRLFVMGHSAGAQIGAMIAFNEEYLVRVGGGTSWVHGFVGLAGPYDFLPFTDEYLHDVFGPEMRYALSQPINFVSDNSVPALLIHGEADRVVWLSNSKSLAAKMRMHGDRVIERYYPDMSHSDVLAALSVYFRGRRAVLDEIDSFIRDEPVAAISSRGAY